VKEKNREGEKRRPKDLYICVRKSKGLFTPHRKPYINPHILILINSNTDKIRAERAKKGEDGEEEG